MIKATLTLAAVSILLGSMLPLQAATTGTTAVVIQGEGTPGQTNAIEDDFAPGLGIFALLMIAILVALVGAGAVLALLVVVILAGLAMLGILTTSAAAGILARRPGAAVSALLLQAGCLLGIAGGAGIGALVAWSDRINSPAWTVIMTGAVAGLVGGGMLARFVDLTWQKVLSVITRRFGR